MPALGQQYALRSTRLDGSIAPIADVPALAPEREGSTPKLSTCEAAGNMDRVRQRRRIGRGSLVKPDVFHPPGAEDVVDVDRQTVHVGLNAGPAGAVINDRPGVVLGQLALDRPQQL